MRVPIPGASVTGVAHREESSEDASEAPSVDNLPTDCKPGKYRVSMSARCWRHSAHPSLWVEVASFEWVPPHRRVHRWTRHTSGKIAARRIAPSHIFCSFLPSA